MRIKIFESDDIEDLENRIEIWAGSFNGKIIIQDWRQSECKDAYNQPHITISVSYSVIE